MKLLWMRDPAVRREEPKPAKMIVLVFVSLVAAVPCRARIISVDDDGPCDFDTIQAAVRDADRGDTVVLKPGIYRGPGNRDIDFSGKAITVRSMNPLDPVTVSATVIDCQGTPADYHRAFVFQNHEDERSVIAGLTLTGGYAEEGGAVACRPYCSPVIKNCVIRGNVAADKGGGIWCLTNKTKILNCLIEGNRAKVYGGGVRGCHGCNLTISNCVIRNNSAGNDGGGYECCKSNATVTGCLFEGNVSGSQGGGIWATYAVTINHCTIVGNRSAQSGGGLYCGFEKNLITNSIIRGNLPHDLRVQSTDTEVSYCNYANVNSSPVVGDLGIGNIQVDPCFATPGHWVQDPSDSSQLMWAGGDYHLKSQAGRWDAGTQSWVKDEATSPCIDAGNPLSPIGLEPFPNGGIVNMGAYGGTIEASRSYFDSAPCERVVAGDLNGDGVVDFRDLSIMALHWGEDNRVRTVTQTVLIPEQAHARALVPANDSLGLGWTKAEFDDSGWLSGKTGVGYDRNDYAHLVNLDISAMRDTNASVYVRIPFEVADSSRFDGLILQMKYEDGFVAYLNGRVVASAHAPAQLAFDSWATTGRSVELALGFQEFDLDSSTDVLQNGRNVLAVHGLNVTPSSPNLLILPKIIAEETDHGVK